MPILLDPHGALAHPAPADGAARARHRRADGAEPRTAGLRSPPEAGHAVSVATLNAIGLGGAGRRVRADDATEAAGRAAPQAGAFSRIVVYEDFAAAAPAWDRLETIASATPYQARRWVLPWLETTGRSTGVTPFIIAAFDDADEPSALFPFGLWRQGTQTIAGFLGGRDSNFNLGLFRPGLVLTPAVLMTVLHAAARLGRRRVDLFLLRNQPHRWNGDANPLSMLPHQPSPSFGYKVALGADPEAFILTILSADNRKKLRQKLARLRAMGPVRHEVARTPEAGAAVLDALIEQRLSRCVAQGLGTHDLPRLRAFIERASVAGSASPVVELHALLAGERIVATFVGTAHQGRYCGMVMSFDAADDVARCSPGEILLESLVRSKCAEGYVVLDLGIGEARYKRTYCPEVEPLFDSLIAVSAKARLWTAGEKARLRLKRWVKQSPPVFAAIRAIRKALRRRGKAKVR